MTMGNKNPETVDTGETLLEVVNILKEHDGARVSEVADILDIARSTAHRHLSTLYQNEYAIKEGDEYHLGLEFLNIGTYTQNRKSEYQLAQETVEELAKETDERAQFIVEEHGRAVYVHRGEGGHAVNTGASIGKTIPLYGTAAGKAILAFLPEERREDLLDQITLQKVTENTITNRDELHEELQDIRDQGYSFNLEENTGGLHAIGAPVKGNNGKVIGGLSVSGPAHRLKDERLKDELPDLVLGYANELELNIIHGSE